MNAGCQSELQLQAKCFQWLWNEYPETRLCCWHVPNGGARSKIEATQLKASGVVKGVHDLHFFWKGSLYVFELKVGTNRQTAEQKAWGEAMKRQGAILYEVREFQLFQNIINSIL